MSFVLCDFDGTITNFDTMDHIVKCTYGEVYQKELEKRYMSGEKEDIRDILSKTSLNEILSILSKENVINDTFFSFYEKCRILSQHVDFYIISSGFKQIITHFIPFIDPSRIYANDFYGNDPYIVKTEIVNNITRLNKNKQTIYIGDGISDFPMLGKVDKLYAKKDSLLEEYCSSKNVNVLSWSSFQDIDISSDYLLLSPGVVRPKLSVLNALRYQHTFMHRHEKFHELYKSIDERIRKIACNNETADEYKTLLVTGSGTTSMDEVLNANVRIGKMLILSNGMFSERWKTIASCYKEKNVITLENDWGDAFCMDNVEMILRENDDIRSVVVVHCDTSVGILNDIHEISMLIQKVNSNITYIVDAVSTFGGIPINMDESHIDFLITNPNKAIASFMGVGIIVCRKTKMACIDYCHYSLDLKRHYENALKYETCNTVSISSLNALLEALKILNIDDNFNSNKIMFDKCYDLIKYEKLLPRNNSCPCIITILVKNAGDIIKYLYDKGIVVYECKGMLYNKGFQISFYGSDGNIFNIENVITIINSYEEF